MNLTIPETKRGQVMKLFKEFGTSPKFVVSGLMLAVAACAPQSTSTSSESAPAVQASARSLA